MIQQQLGFKDNTSAFEQRTLEDDVPELLNYLHPGAYVLDVGCGSGSISLDVASEVDPGTVVGVDLMESRIANATDLASDQNVGNISFEVSDAHSLRFPDNSFDVVYSHTVLHSLIDPQRALMEQQRVVKPGGWVIASGVRDWGFSPRFPACPALEKILAAWQSYSELLFKRYVSGAKIPGQQDRQFAEFRYIDIHTARKCPSWFRKAGLTNLQMQFKVESFEFSGSEEMTPSMTLIPPRDAPDDPLWDVYRDLMTEGLLDQATLDSATEEVVAWYANPDAFNLIGLLFIAGSA